MDSENIARLERLPDGPRDGALLRYALGNEWLKSGDAQRAADYLAELAGPGVDDPMAVVIITTFDLDEYVFSALRAGAEGFLLKDAGSQLLAQAVRAAATGDALIAPNVTVRLLEAFAGAGPSGGTPGSPRPLGGSPDSMKLTSIRRAAPSIRSIS